MANEIEEKDKLTGEIVDAAYKLHTGLGPGLLESIYETVLARDLERRGCPGWGDGMSRRFGIKFQSQEMVKRKIEKNSRLWSNGLR